jgi:hypothetical protein
MYSTTTIKRPPSTYNQLPGMYPVKRLYNKLIPSYVNVELPRVRGRTKRARLPPRPVFPRVVHEGRGGYIAIDTGAREYRYPIELVGEGRFCIHYPAGNRLRDRDVHLAALEEMCRAEPSRWTLERRDR